MKTSVVKPDLEADVIMPLTFKVGDRVRYVGRTREACDQEQGDLGTVVWSGDIDRIDQPPLVDWVGVTWDNPKTKIPINHVRADQVRAAE